MGNKIIDFFKIEYSIIKKGLPIFLLFYIINLELDPKMGNIWYRINQYGKKQFNLGGIINMFISPLNNYILWHYKLWSINPYIMAYLFLFSIKQLEYLNNKK